jgi:hypothetical protein
MATPSTVPDHRLNFAVKKKTGKSLEQWNTILDRWNWKSKDIDRAIRQLRRRYGLSAWGARVLITRYQMQRRPRH